MWKMTFEIFIKYAKNVRKQSCSFQKDLQFLSHAVSDKT